jgi:putative membrane protein
MVLTGILFLLFIFNKLFNMKKIIMPFGLMAFLAFAAGCGGGTSTDTTTRTDSSTAMSNTMDTSHPSSPTASAMGSHADTSMGDDQKFVMEASSGGLMEVALGKIAETNAASAQVKEFGRMMVTDHTKANTELKALAAQKSITISSTPMEKHQKNIDELKAKKGADFDKAYVDMMVDDHKEDVEKFQNEANKGNDAAIKAFAAKTLPVLQKHLDHIQKIKDGMKK